MAKKVLIVYGTRYGATESTSKEIVKVLGEKGIGVQLINAKKERVKSVSQYDMVIVGSGMQMARWTGAAASFLNKFQKELANKKLAIFVSSGAKALLIHQKKTDEVEKARKQYLEDKAAKYNLRPFSTTVFGGVWDFNKMFFLFRKALSGEKPKIEAAGFKEIRPGLYDTRDWENIRKWAGEMAESVMST